MGNRKDSYRVFHSLGNPARARLVELLAAGELSLGRIAARFPMTRPAVSKHLRVLAAAGVVTEYWRGREHIYGLRAEFLDELESWSASVRALGRQARSSWPGKAPESPEPLGGLSVRPPERPLERTAGGRSISIARDPEEAVVPGDRSRVLPPQPPSERADSVDRSPSSNAPAEQEGEWQVW